MNRYLLIGATLGLSLAAAPLVSTHSIATAQGAPPAARPYREGPVTLVTFVRTKPGMLERYMQYLQTRYKKEMEAEKAAGLIVDYGVFTTDPRDPQDHDLLLVVQYKNNAALDNLADRTDAIANRVMGNTPEQRDQQLIDRGAMREILGTRRYQELVLK